MSSAKEIQKDTIMTTITTNMTFQHVTIHVHVLPTHHWFYLAHCSSLPIFVNASSDIDLLMQHKLSYVLVSVIARSWKDMNNEPNKTIHIFYNIIDVDY